MNSIKLVFPTDDKKTISPHFGRAGGFYIAEIVDGKIVKEEFLLNPFSENGKGHHVDSAHHHIRGSNHSSEKHAVIAERFVGVDAVVAKGIGEGMRRKLESAGIKIIITDEDRIDAAIEKFIKGILQDISASSKCSCRHHS